MAMVSTVRKILQSNPAWIAGRRWQREGFLKAFRRSRLWRRVLESPPVRTSSCSPSAIEVHALCYKLDHLTAIWALKTFYRSAQVDFPLVIHVNGTAMGAVCDRLRFHFPDARLVPREVADQVVESRLIASGLTRLVAARRASPFMVKLTDFPILAKGEVVLGFDGDVLFFAEPNEMLDQSARPTRGYLFQRDIGNGYNISREEALHEFGIHLAPQVNTGFLVYPRDLPDLFAFERYLEHPGVARANWSIEQTLYALHASELASVAYLPARYLIDNRAGLSFDGLTARHYAGSTRPLLTSEGMPHVLRSGLLMGARA